MYLIAIGWLYVALMMAVAEAFHPTGSVLGGIATFVGYGLLPTALVLYIGGAPARRRRRRAEEQRALEAAPPSAAPPDGGGHAPGHAVAPEREEP